MKQSIRIYSFYYKHTVIPVENDLYHPVMAGNGLNTTPSAMTGDDTGDSISEKNPWFSELTGIYWVWKNTSQDVTGCCHYRRYFTAKKEPAVYQIKRWLYFPVRLYQKRYGLIYTRNINRFRKRMLNAQEITEILKTYDAILPQKRKLNYSVRKHYERYHHAEDLRIVEKILEDYSPEYLPAYFQVMNGNRLFANNMFVMPQQHLDKFLSWWFTVLFAFEKQTDLKNYTGYQKRIAGFLGERLLTVWFQHNQLKVMELPVIYFKKIKRRF